MLKAVKSSVSRIVINAILVVLFTSVPLHSATKTQLMQEDISYVNPLKYGTALNATTLQAAVTAIGSLKRTLLVTTGTWTLAANITIPANIFLHQPAGALITINSGVTLSIRGGYFCADTQKCFSVSSTNPVLFDSSISNFSNGIKYVSVMWFGVTNDGVGSAANSTGLQAAINAFSTRGGKVYFPAGSYIFPTAPVMKAGIILSGVEVPTGAEYATQVAYSGTGAPTALFDLRGLAYAGVQYMYIRHSVGSVANTYGIWLGKEYQVVRYVLVQNFTGAGSVGIRVTATAELTSEHDWGHFEHVRSDGNTVGIILESINGNFNNNNHYYNLQVTNNVGDGLQINGAVAVNIYGLDAEGNGTGGTGYNVNIIAGSHIYIFGGWIEGTATVCGTKGSINFPVGSTSNYSIYYYGIQDSEPCNFYYESSKTYFMSQPRQLSNSEQARFSALSVTNLTPNVIQAVAIGTVANDAVVALGAAPNPTFGYLFLHTSAGIHGQCIFYLQGGNNTVRSIADPAALCSLSQGTAGKTNVYYNGGFVLQNKTGTSQVYSGTMLGPN